MTSSVTPAEIVPSGRRPPIVLVVDDLEVNRQLMAAYLEEIPCSVWMARDGQEALELTLTNEVDLVLLDVDMPGANGIAVCRELKARERGRLLPVVMVTALSSLGDRVAALNAGADDLLAKPVDRVELIARTTSALRLKSVYDSLEEAEQVIYTLSAAVEARDSYTEAHTHRVAALAESVGRGLGLPTRETDELIRGGLVHDIGKIGIPDAVLLKAGRLSQSEAEIMRRHPVIGEAVVRDLRSSSYLRPIIRHHHERVDGRGYPDGLSGEEIPLGARIIAACDAFDAMTTDRPYRSARTVSSAIDELMAGRGRQWDRDVVDQLVQAVAAAPPSR